LRGARRYHLIHNETDEIVLNVHGEDFKKIAAFLVDKPTMYGRKIAP
jgi:hypothetical protein